MVRPWPVQFWIRPIPGAFLPTEPLLGQEPASASSGLLLGSPAPPLSTDYIAQASWGPGVSIVIPGDVLGPAGVGKSQQVAFRSWLLSMNTVGQVRVSHGGRATAAKRTAGATAGAEATVRLSAMSLQMRRGSMVISSAM